MVCVVVPSSLAFAQSAPDRTVTVRVIVDADENLDRATRAVLFASDVFRKNFGITFLITATETWPSKEGKVEKFAAINRVRAAADESRDDIVISFTTRSMHELGENQNGWVREYPIDGCADLLGRAAVVSLGGNAGKSRRRTALVTLHEFGHVFGAQHSGGKESIMTGNKIVSQIFDEKTKETILKNRDRPFGTQAAE